MKVYRDIIFNLFISMDYDILGQLCYIHSIGLSSIRKDEKTFYLWKNFISIDFESLL